MSKTDKGKCTIRKTQTSESEKGQSEKGIINHENRHIINRQIIPGQAPSDCLNKFILRQNTRQK